MGRLLSFTNRLLPLATLILMVIMVAQFLIHDGPTLAGMTRFFWHCIAVLRSIFWYLCALALFLWLLVLLGINHERRSNERLSSPDATKPEGWTVDILDRLTNRQELEQKLAGETQSVVIDSAELANLLESKVVGQAAVCQDMAAQIRRRLALTQRDKPIGVFLFAGPPGTGKTYLAKQLAIALRRKLLYFDMTQFAQPFKVTQLFGSPKGYSGSDTYGKLTAGLRDTPDSVVLLDEIEKAHPDVHKNFLTAWNDGFLTEASDGRQISTSKAIFVMTTNAATEALQELLSLYADDHDELRRASINALRESGFAPEVLNRIDRVFVFAPLSGLDIARVTALAIEDMVRSYGLLVADGGIDPELLYDMLKKQSRLGSDASSRDIVRSAEEIIADSLIDAKQKGYLKVALTLADGKVTVRPVRSVSTS